MKKNQKKQQEIMELWINEEKLIGKKRESEENEIIENKDSKINTEENKNDIKINVKNR